jgi:hypothetical protein
MKADKLRGRLPNASNIRRKYPANIHGNEIETFATIHFPASRRHEGVVFCGHWMPLAI